MPSPSAGSAPTLLVGRGTVTPDVRFGPAGVFPAMVGRPTPTAILSALPDAVIVTDGDGRVTYLNPAAERASGWSHADVLGASVSRLLRRERRRALASKNLHVAGDSQPYQLVSRTGTPRAVEACESVLTDERGLPTGRIYVCRDVGAALALSQAMAHGALHDPLTGLANRRRLLERLQEALTAAARRETPVGVCFLDVDGMKAVNDSQGHDAGDLLLRSIATRLLASVRASDTVARIGGDEFVVVLHRLEHPRDAAPVTRSLTRRLHRPHRVGTRKVRITASMGWAFSSKDGREPQELLVTADRAMYEAKRARAAASVGGPAEPQVHSTKGTTLLRASSPRM